MNEVFLCAYKRTPIGRFGGALATVRPDDLAAIPIRALINELPYVDWEQIDDLMMGAANQAGEDNRNVGRMAALLAGLPESTPGTTINRLCGSGMDAIIQGARAIACGQADLILAGGVESMSRAPFVIPKAEHAYSREAELFDTTIGWRFINPVLQAEYGTDSMPETAENVAQDFNVSREDQDNFALRSQQKAAASIDIRAREITPVQIPQRKGEPIRVEYDEHPRADTTYEALAKLRAPFASENGSVTAGNSSGVNDGAAMTVLASAEGVKRHGLAPIVRIGIGVAVGLAPRIMGFGPALAVERLLKRCIWSIDDVDTFEINEAFASQALATTRHLQLPDDDPRLNPHGGAIALGHPLGMSGTRIVGTLALEMQRNNKRRGVASMCIGVGQGLAVALEVV